MEGRSDVRRTEHHGSGKLGSARTATPAPLSPPGLARSTATRSARVRPTPLADKKLSQTHRMATGRRLQEDSTARVWLWYFLRTPTSQRIARELRITTNEAAGEVRRAQRLLRAGFTRDQMIRWACIELFKIHQTPTGRR